jgi:ABC-type multidrug transport system ATPase subunit
MPSASPLLLIDGLRFAYPEVPLFADLSAQVPAGTTLVLGADSSGKTTLLRLLAGELAAGAGQLVLQGVSLQSAPADYRARVFWGDPRAGALDEQGVQDWLAALPARYPQFDAAALARHIEGFGLHEHLAKRFLMLSTGTRRKVWTAGALASGAPLTLLDEPVAGLDKPSIQYLQQALAEVAYAADRAVVVAHYDALAGVPWQATLELPDR